MPAVNPLVPRGKLGVLGEGPGRLEMEIFEGGHTWGRACLSTGKEVFQHSDDLCDCTSDLLSISSVCREGGTEKSAEAPGELVSSPFYHQEKCFHSKWVAGHWSHLAQRPKVPSLLSEGTPPPSTLGSSEGRLPPLTPLHIVARLPHHWLHFLCVSRLPSPTEGLSHPPTLRDDPSRLLLGQWRRKLRWGCREREGSRCTIRAAGGGDPSSWYKSPLCPLPRLPCAAISVSILNSLVGCFPAFLLGVYSGENNW